MSSLRVAMAGFDITPEHARPPGTRLGRAAARALPTLVPARGEPFDFAFETIELPRQPMPSRGQFGRELAEMRAYLDDLENDPSLTWCCGMNLPEQVSAELKAVIVATADRLPPEELADVGEGHHTLGVAPEEQERQIAEHGQKQHLGCDERDRPSPLEADVPSAGDPKGDPEVAQREQPPPHHQLWGNE